MGRQTPQKDPKRLADLVKRATKARARLPGIVEQIQDIVRRVDPTELLWQFTIEDMESGVTVYWEHCVMLHVPSYRQRWEAKRASYRSHAIRPHRDGGANGILIVTRDKRMEASSRRRSPSSLERSSAN